MDWSRRELLASLAVAGLLPATLPIEKLPGKPRRTLRIVFMTDAHLKAPNEDENKGNTRILKAFEVARRAKPDATLFGGDNVMAVDYGNSLESATGQFENWKSKITEHVPGKKMHVIGNHDIWNGEVAKNHALGGKKYALQAFAMPNRYFAEDIGKWRFLMLDSFHADGCHFDDEQLKWIESQLASAPENVAVMSHASIVNAGHILESKAKGRVNGYNSPSGWVIGNAADVVRMFAKSGKVKLALSGHMHQVDRVELLGTAHICGGAVSGAWWGGIYLDHFPCNLMVLDLHENGKVDHYNLEFESPDKR